MKFSTPLRINNLLNQYDGIWMIAGGWAIDLFLNKITRSHKDIEIIIPRNEQKKLKEYLKNWTLKFVESGKLKEWDDETLRLPIHEIHCTKKNCDMKLEVLLNEMNQDLWQYRRNLVVEKDTDAIMGYNCNS